MRDHKAVVCLTRSSSDAASIVHQLERSGFERGDISVVPPTDIGVGELVHRASTKMPEGMAVGGSIGGVLGGALGVAASLGGLPMALPEALVVAGPAVLALAGMGLLGAIGGIFGGLIGLALPEYEACIYEGTVRDGKVLLAVHTADKAEIDHALHLFKEGGGEAIHVSRETRTA